MACVSWCTARAVDPVTCPVGSVLKFLRDKFAARASTIILRVYFMAIAACRESDMVPLGRVCLVS